MSKQGLFSEDWLEIQRKYWDGWTEMSRKALGTEDDATRAWESALDHWWKALSPATPDAAKEFMERMIDQGKVFFRLAETFVPGAGVGSGTNAWSALNKTLEDLQGSFSGSLQDSGDALHRMMAFWELPYDNWQRMMSSLSPIPGDFLRNMPHDPVRGHVERVLSAPGLGYTREEQGQYQDLIRRTLDYQNALQDYLAFYAKLGVKSVERMRGYLQGLVDSGKSIDSARAIYDNWVRCCEEVYGEEVITPEYARIHGHLINAQMALKKRMSVMVDESLGALNMPSRSELRTLQDRLQETRRENKRLRQDLLVLQRQVASLAAAAGGEKPAAAPASRTQAQPRATPATRPPMAVKPTAAKKTAARKKAASKPASD
jgi:class III poly(R)-hydroxyalkanoic acid synthase PhaE subunit